MRISGSFFSLFLNQDWSEKCHILKGISHKSEIDFLGKITISHWKIISNRIA